MASKINSSPIDQDYPRAGEDNDSQGFRDNFSAIKNALQTASEETTDLQNNAARKDRDNDFVGNTLERPNLKNFTQHKVTGDGLPAGAYTTTTDNNGIASNTTIELDVALGNYFAFTIVSDTQLTLKNWPEENYSRIIVELTTNYDDRVPFELLFKNDKENKIVRGPNNAWAETFDESSVSIFIGGEENVDTGDSTEANIESVHIIEFWTHTGGETVYARYMGTFGVGPASTIIYELGDINDVFAENVQDGDIIVYREDANGPGIPGWVVQPVPEGGGGGGAEPIVIASAEDDFTLSLANINEYIRVSSFGTVDVTIPLSPDIPIGSSTSFFQSGEGTIRIVPTDSVIVNSVTGFLTTREQYSAMTITKIGENEWDLIGDLAAFEFVCGVSWLALGDDQYALKDVTIGDTVPVATELPLIGTGGQQMLYLQDPYGNNAIGGFSFVTNTDTGQLEAEFGTAEPRHDLLIFATDDSNPVNYYTLGSEFASDEAVIYFRPSFDTLTLSEVTYTLNLIYRDPNQYAAFSPGSSAASQTFTITAEELTSHRSGVFAIPFPEPGAFNGISIEAANASGAIVDFRLCLDSAQMIWPFNAPIPLGDVPDDPIIITNFDNYTQDTTVLPDDPSLEEPTSYYYS